jgi:DNA-binding transcriptional ArsR family regulator
MRIVLNSLRKYPVLWHAASKAGIHRKALEYWIRCSARPIIGVRNTQWEWPSAMQHLGVLEAAGLVRSEPTSGPGIPDAIARALAALVAEELIDHGFDEHRHQRN